MDRQRRADWSRRLYCEIDLQQALDFKWGQSDCTTFMADCVEAMTGRDPIKGMRFYGSARAGVRVLQRAGFMSVADLVADRFAQIPVAQAMRGDLVYPEVITSPIMAPAVLLGSLAISRDQSGFVTFARHQAARAFRVI